LTKEQKTTNRGAIYLSSPPYQGNPQYAQSNRESTTPTSPFLRYKTGNHRNRYLCIYPNCEEQ